MELAWRWGWWLCCGAASVVDVHGSDELCAANLPFLLLGFLPGGSIIRSSQSAVFDEDSILRKSKRCNFCVFW